MKPTIKIMSLWVHYNAIAIYFRQNNIIIIRRKQQVFKFLLVNFCLQIIIVLNVVHGRLFTHNKCVMETTIVTGNKNFIFL